MTSTALKRRLTPEWRNCIKTNLREGVPFQTIVALLLQNDFEPAYAMTAVQILKDEAESEPEYRYETPRFSHDGKYIQTSDRRVMIQARMEKPCIAILEDVLSPEECDQLIALSGNRLNRSETLDLNTGEAVVVEGRTSLGTFFKRGEHELIVRVERRFAEIMNMPLEHGEGLQVLHYKPGTEYKPHVDFFQHNQKGNGPLAGKKHQRVSTLVVYLNDVEEGGATTFPSIGLTVLPKKGSAVYFEYCNSLGQLDGLTLHAGAPVIKGEKWAVTQWMRNKPLKSQE